MSDPSTPSLRDYDSDRYGPFLGISDDGSCAAAIRDAALGSPKARALDGASPLLVGVGHDAERLRSVGEVPVGPEQYEAIRAASAGHVLMTTNIGSHVNVWHYMQPPSLQVTADMRPEDAAAWAHERAALTRDRTPQPWLRLRFDAAVASDARLQTLRAATVEAPVCIAVHAELGAAEATAAIALAAAASAPAVVVDGVACAPTEGRPALPGLLNYFPAAQARELLRAARSAGVAIEPALKIDTDSVANQVWTGLYAARAMGLHLGKYGLFPLTFQEMEPVVAKVQAWMRGWTAAPVFYVDVPWVDGDNVYDVDDARDSTERWLTMVARQGAEVVLVDTVDKGLGRHLVRRDPDDRAGVFSWDDLEALREVGNQAGLRVLWAGGMGLSQLREFGRRRFFGVYVTTAAAQAAPLGPEEELDIGLAAAKRPEEHKIGLVKLLLEAGFLDGDASQSGDGQAAEAGDDAAAGRLASALEARWRQRLDGTRGS